MIVSLPSNKYDQIEEIARGGMGIVFKAHHKYLHRWTAVKVLYPHLAADVGFIERFKREARTMARLAHDGIIRIYDVEPGEETYYLVMEYVEGQDLKRLASARGVLSADEVAAAAIQVGEALAYAHREGVIHRDIKPGNIMVGADRRVKVGDFGIAAAMDEMALTTSGHLLGTPEYMAPEQLRGGPADGRTDLYALGMTMATLLIGQSPFHGLTRAAILADLTSLDEYSLVFPATVPAGLQAVIRRLVKRRLADRYQRAEDLVEELRGLARTRGGGAEVTPVPAATPLDERESPTEDLRGSETQPVEAQPAAVWTMWPKMAAAVAGLLIVAGGAAWLWWGQPGRAPDPPARQAPGGEAALLREVKNALELTHDRMKVAREAAKEAGAERVAPVLAQAGRRAETQGDLARQEGSALIATSDLVRARRSLEQAAASYRGAEVAYRQAIEAATTQVGRAGRPVKAVVPAVALRPGRPGEPARQAASVSPEPVVASPHPVSARGEGAADKPDLPDIEAVTARLEAVRSAAARRDLGAVRGVLDLAPERARLLAQLFHDYQEVRLAVEQVQINQEAATAHLAFEHLVNQAGQAVVPAESWRRMEVRLEKRGGAWGLPRW